MQKPILNLYIFTVENAIDSVLDSVYSHKLSVTYGYRRRNQTITLIHAYLYNYLVGNACAFYVYLLFCQKGVGCSTPSNWQKVSERPKTMAIVRAPCSNIFVCILANASFYFSSADVSLVVHVNIQLLSLLLSLFFWFNVSILLYVSSVRIIFARYHPLCCFIIFCLFRCGVSH